LHIITVAEVTNEQCPGSPKRPARFWALAKKKWGLFSSKYGGFGLKSDRCGIGRKSASPKAVCHVGMCKIQANHGKLAFRRSAGKDETGSRDSSNRCRFFHTYSSASASEPAHGLTKFAEGSIGQTCPQITGAWYLSFTLNVRCPPHCNTHLANSMDRSPDYQPKPYCASIQFRLPTKNPRPMIRGIRNVTRR
jgi:hypothetical protein